MFIRRRRLPRSVRQRTLGRTCHEAGAVHAARNWAARIARSPQGPQRRRNAAPRTRRRIPLIRPRSVRHGRWRPARVGDWCAASLRAAAIGSIIARGTPAPSGPPGVARRTQRAHEQRDAPVSRLRIAKPAVRPGHRPVRPSRDRPIPTSKARRADNPRPDADTPRKNAPPVGRRSRAPLKCSPATCAITRWPRCSTRSMPRAPPWW